MPKNKNYAHYRKKVARKSIFDGNPTLVLNRYWTPEAYILPVQDVLTAFKSGIPFNRAVDQVYTLNKSTIKRDKLAEHTLKTIANDY